MSISGTKYSSSYDKYVDLLVLVIGNSIQNGIIKLILTEKVRLKTHRL